MKTSFSRIANAWLPVPQAPSSASLAKQNLLQVHHLLQQGKKLVARKRYSGTTVVALRLTSGKGGIDIPAIGSKE